MFRRKATNFAVCDALNKISTQTGRLENEFYTTVKKSLLRVGNTSAIGSD